MKKTYDRPRVLSSIDAEFFTADKWNGLYEGELVNPTKVARQVAAAFDINDFQLSLFRSLGERDLIYTMNTPLTMILSARALRIYKSLAVVNDDANESNPWYQVGLRIARLSANPNVTPLDEHSLSLLVGEKRQRPAGEDPFDLRLIKDDGLLQNKPEINPLDILYKIGDFKDNTPDKNKPYSIINSPTRSKENKE